MDDEHYAINRAWWDERAPAHASSPDYAVQELIADPTRLSDVVRFDLPRLGDINGQRGIHLQCHIGTDTISLHRLGATMTGLDFSSESIAIARRIASDARADVTFVQTDVYSAPSATTDTTASAATARSGTTIAARSVLGERVSGHQGGPAAGTLGLHTRSAGTARRHPPRSAGRCYRRGWCNRGRRRGRDRCTGRGTLRRQIRTNRRCEDVDAVALFVSSVVLKWLRKVNPIAAITTKAVAAAITAVRRLRGDLGCRFGLSVVGRSGWSAGPTIVGAAIVGAVAATTPGAASSRLHRWLRGGPRRIRRMTGSGRRVPSENLGEDGVELTRQRRHAIDDVGDGMLSGVRT